MLNKQIIVACSQLHIPHTCTPRAIHRISFMLYPAEYIAREDTNFSRPVKPTILREQEVSCKPLEAIMQLIKLAKDT
jgi:hypothetical protein